MTTAAQRIWEAIYAAEFVSRLDEAIEAHAEPDECDIERALCKRHGVEITNDDPNEDEEGGTT